MRKILKILWEKNGGVRKRGESCGEIEREREKKRNVCSFEGKKGGKVLTVTVLSFKKKITILLLGELECYGQYKWKLEKKNITNYLLNGILYWGFIKKAEQRQDLITHLTRNAWRRLSYLSIPKRKMSSLWAMLMLER